MVGYRFNTIGVSDAISMGTDGMSFSLQSRDLIADSIETVRAARTDPSCGEFPLEPVDPRASVAAAGNVSAAMHNKECAGVITSSHDAVGGVAISMCCQR